MGGLPNIAGLVDVQARIATINARFSDAGGTQGTAAAANGSATANQADFAALLANAASPEVGGTTASSDSSTSATRTQFAHDVLQSLGAPQTAENVRAIVAWAQAEGTAASFNPLATTENAPGATSFNRVGVKNYPTYAEGVQATVATLTNGRYANILAALADGTSAQQVAQAVAQSPWGTGSHVLQVLQSGTV